jgi:C1A family cysteine protease
MRAFAVAYGARSIEQYYTSNASSYRFDLNIFSPEYVYNQTKFGECGSGTAITTVLDLIKSQGVANWQAMPYSDVNGCSLQPDPSQVSNASAYKIASYAKIANTDQVAIKTMITLKHPVITTILADNSFVNAGAGFIWKIDSGLGVLPHICGYDDAKHAYKVMNSWGSSWGDGGFSWIDYDLLPQKSSFYTYVIQ